MHPLTAVKILFHDAKSERTVHINRKVSQALVGRDDLADALVSFTCPRNTKRRQGVCLAVHLLQ